MTRIVNNERQPRNMPPWADELNVRRLYGCVPLAFNLFLLASATFIALEQTLPVSV